MTTYTKNVLIFKKKSNTAKERDSVVDNCQCVIINWREKEMYKKEMFGLECFTYLTILSYMCV